MMNAGLALPLEDAEITPLVTIVGAGPVGTGLAGRLVRSGVPVAALYGRTLEQAAEAGLHAGALGLCDEVSSLVRAADVVIVAVADSKLAGAAAAALEQGIIGPTQVVLHTSGAWASSEALAVVSGKAKAVGTMHPLASLSQRRGAWDRLVDVAFAVEGAPEAVKVSRRLVAMMKGRALPLEAARLPLYHAGAAMGSNLVVALVDLARRVLEAAGVETDAAVPALSGLLRSTADNLSRQGLPHALTGPVARGDVQTVKRHLEALERALPEVLDLYRRLGAEVLAVAERRASGLDGQAASALRSLLGQAP